jgi:hypothetical protein
METKHNDELYELLNGPYVVKYIKVKRLKWVRHLVRMDNTRIPKKSTEWNTRISWKKTCRKTMAETGSHQEGLIVAAEYNRMEETSTGQGYLEANY